MGKSAPENPAGGGVEGIDKVMASVDHAVADILNGATILVGGFGGSGFPSALRDALIRRRPEGITVVCNNADLGGFVYDGGLRKIICSFPVGDTSRPILEAIEAGQIELELTPQGTLAERLRAGGSGLGGVLSPTGVGTWFGPEHSIVKVDGEQFVLSKPIRGDVALIRGSVADRYGNVVTRHAARNFNPVMAMAARVTIVEVAEIVEPGEIDPDHVHIPAAFVDRIVRVA